MSFKPGLVPRRGRVERNTNLRKAGPTRRTDVFARQAQPPRGTVLARGRERGEARQRDAVPRGGRFEG